ncbi:hypothetical protein [Streptomyces sp. Isolate_45]|uniref:hypothetical protein n=1 Tax=Streptomyces sp. Isolate_45 TaxID=2950111 RepID=UPI002481E928|nr:hypothetical protein [Streptomyces sp. Isolate_45]MDA5279865.1 hypothetical protein [Streptomyces sp. Isolate_45]
MTSPTDLPGGAEEYGGVDPNATIVRGTGPRSVTFYREMAFGGQVVHSLDYVVLTHVLFAIAANEEITVPGIWKRLQALGIRSAKNSKELVGKNSVYESFNRIIEAGFIRRGRLPHPAGGGRKGKVVYQVFEFVADNPDHQGAPLTPLPGTGEVVSKDHVSAGQATSRNPGSGVPGSGFPGSGAKRVPAGQPASRVPGSGSALPPTPPRGMESPLTPGATTVPTVSVDAVTGGRGRERSARQAKPSIDPAVFEAAVEFLLDLPGNWACGLGLAKKSAPLLVEACARTGWELGPALAAELTKNPDGLKQPWRAIPKRIEEDLKRRSASPVQVEPEGQRCPHHPSRSLAECPCQRAGNEPSDADAAAGESGGDDSAAGGNVEDVRVALNVLSQGARGSRSRNGRAQGLKKMQQQRVVEESADRARYLDELAGLMQHEQTGA